MHHDSYRRLELTILAPFIRRLDIYIISPASDTYWVPAPTFYFDHITDHHHHPSHQLAVTSSPPHPRPLDRPKRGANPRAALSPSITVIPGAPTPQHCNLHPQTPHWLPGLSANVTGTVAATGGSRGGGGGYLGPPPKTQSGLFGSRKRLNNTIFCGFR